jgi:hypothetical protein
VADSFSRAAQEHAALFGVTLLPFEALIRIFGVIEQLAERLPLHFVVWMLFSLTEMAGPFDLPAMEIASNFRRQVEKVGEQLAHL